MAKNIFRTFEVQTLNDELMLSLTKTFEPETIVEEAAIEPVEEAPSIEELKQEIEQSRIAWEQEKAQLLAEAQQQAHDIIENAKKAAFDEVKRQTDESQLNSQKAKEEAQALVNDAEKKAQEIIGNAEEKEAAAQKKAYQEGFNSGREEGFTKGQAESDRLIERLHKMIETTMKRREDILIETEQQIVDLVLLMTRKVVKVISENQRNVVSSNIIHALRKIKGRGDVTIRVNLADVGLTTEHTKDFLAAVENIQNITVVEDLSVDAGGCIVETDFGAVDARIASQLSELEQRILEISPIKAHSKPTHTANKE